MGRGAPVGEAHRPPTIGAMAFFKPATGDTWLGLGEEPLPVQQVLSWVGLPDCGAVVLFTGNARNHTEGRTNVTGLAYEAYEEQVIPRFEEMVDEARRRWDPVGRLVILHRTGPVKIGDAAVLVAVSAHTGRRRSLLAAGASTPSRRPCRFGSVKPGRVANTGRSTPSTLSTSPGPTGSSATPRPSSP